MKKNICRILVFLLAAGMFAFHASFAEKELTLEYYFLNACEQCTPEEDFAGLFRRLTGTEPGDREVHFHNVYLQQGRADYEAATAGWPEEERKLPLLIAGSDHYAGQTSVEQGIRLRFGTAEEDTDSRAWFLVSTACESCARARDAVDARPAIVPLEAGGRMVSSAVTVTEINVDADPTAAMALLEQYGVEDANRMTPMILMGPDTVLAGEREITENFLPLLKTGAALHTRAAETGGTAGTGEFLSLAGAAAAGLAAGFNPCALSMLLAFAGMLLSLHRSVLRNGLLYLAGKLALYLLIGFGLAGVWIRIAPDGFPLAVRIVVTAVGAALIVMNLADAASACREAYGEIRNQLPAPLRGGLRRVIRKAAGSRQAGLAAVILGVVVGAGEFMCAGQLYLGMLISGAGSPPAIAAYCMAFLAPSIAVLCLIASGRHAAESAGWVLRYMPAIKTAAAIAMAAILVFLWTGR